MQRSNETYQVPSGEEHLYHVTLEIIAHSPSTGERISRPMLKKIGYKSYNTLISDFKRQGYTVTILHEPINPKLAKRQAQVKKQVEKIDLNEKIKEASENLLDEYKKGEDERIKAAVEAALKSTKSEPKEAAKADKK